MYRYELSQALLTRPGRGEKSPRQTNRKRHGGNQVDAVAAAEIMESIARKQKKEQSRSCKTEPKGTQMFRCQATTSHAHRQRNS